VERNRVIGLKEGKEIRDDSIRVRVTTAEKEEIITFAKKEGFTELSDFIREVLKMWMDPKAKRERFAHDFQSYIEDHPELKKKLGL
jgi:hypothetical protein